VVDFGVKTPLQHGSWSDFLAVWRAVDQLDVFESAWTMDHFYPLAPPLDGTILESWSVLAAMAHATTRVRFGCMVNGMPYRHPAVTANMAATVDHISGGRLTLGLGAGWHEVECAAYGIELGSLTERFDRFEEGVEVVTSLLADEHTTFHGRYYDLTDARCEPKPVQARVPIAIGGRGRRRTLRTVARFADHWDVTGMESPAMWRELNDVLLGHCDAVGRDPTTIRRSVHMMWPPDADVAAMVDQARSFGEAGVDLAVFSMRGPYTVALIEGLAEAIAR
jgi:F420-dependent oxidoreductase-like protein